MLCGGEREGGKAWLTGETLPIVSLSSVVKICDIMLQIIPEKLNFPQLITYSEICNFPKISNFPWCVFPILFVIGGVNDLSEKFDLKTNKSQIFKNDTSKICIKICVFKQLSIFQELRGLQRVKRKARVTALIDLYIKRKVEFKRTQFHKSDLKRIYL